MASWAKVARSFVARRGAAAQQVRRGGLLLGLLVGAHAAAAAPAPLRVVIDAEPAHLNPLLDPDLWGYRVAHDLLCEPLLRRRPDGTYEGVLAERVSLDADGTGADVALRRGVRFHDGRALTAHDVRFTLERVQSASHTAPRTQALTADLRRVAVLSADRLHLDLARPSGRLQAMLAEIDILPEHVFAQGPFGHQLRNRRPVCTGPYRVHEWRRGAELVLRRSPTYWGPPPRTEELRFLIVPDGARALALTRRGGAEILSHVPPLYLPEQVEPAMLRGRLRRLEVPANQVALVLWNGRHPALGLPPVRRALSRLLDRARLVREVRRGLGDALQLPPPLESGPGAPDLAAAEALLDQAGAPRLPGGGARSFGGRPLRITLLCPVGASEVLEAARRIAADAAAAGVKVEPEALELSALQARLRRGAFDAALLAWAWTGEEPDWAPLLRRGGAQAYGHSASDELDAAIEAARRAAGPERRRTALGRLAALLLEQEPVTFLYRPRDLLLLDQRLRPDPPPLSGDFPLLRALYIE